MLSALLCAYAAISKNFWLLVLGTFIAPAITVLMASYIVFPLLRTHRPQTTRDKAVSWVPAGGILGAVIGPNLASWTRDLFDTAFLGAYLTLSIADLIEILVMQFIQFPAELKTKHSLADGRHPESDTPTTSFYGRHYGCRIQIYMP